MTNKEFQAVPQKLVTVANDEIVLIDSEDGNKLKRGNASAFKGEKGDPGEPGPAGGVASVTGTMVDNTDSANPIVLSDSTKANDSAVVHNTGDETIAGVKTFTSEVKITEGDGAVSVRDEIIHSAHTGVDDGGVITILNGTQFSVSSGAGQIVNTGTTPYTFTNVTWTTQTITNTFLSSASTYVYVNSDGSIYQTNVPLTFTLYTGKILLGIIANVGGVQAGASPRMDFIENSGHQIQEFFRLWGAINLNNSIKVSANGANLNINSTAGQIWRLGSNAVASQADSTVSPNVKQIAATTAPQIYQYYTDAGGSIVSNGNNAALNVTQYNNAGVLTTIPSNKYVNALITQSTNGNFLELLPDRYYNSLAEAVADLGKTNITIPTLIADQCQIAWITYKEGVTALNNETYVKISPISIGGVSGGGSTGGGGDMLASTYDPAGIAQQLVGTTATQTLTNKTINATDNTITDTSTATGDLFKSNGTKFVRFAKGTASQQLRVNAGGTDIEWFTPSAGGGSSPVVLFTTAGTAYQGKVYKFPAFTGTITKLMISLDTLPVGGNFEVYIAKNGTSMLSGNLTITTTETATNSMYTVATGDSGKATMTTTAVTNEDRIDVYVVAGSGNTFLGAGVTISAIMSAS